MLSSGIISVYADEEPTVEWEKTFGGINDDIGYSVQQTSDSGYIIAGRTASFGAGEDDVYLIKTYSNGTKQWEKTFGGSNHDYALSVQQTSDNGYIITGFTDSFGVGDPNVYLIKTDSNGNKQWERTFGGNNSDSGRSVQQTSDNGYIIAGSTNSFSTDEYGDLYLIKTTSNGNKQWEKKFGGDNLSYYGLSVQQTSDGGYIISGGADPLGAGEYDDVYLIKTDSNGNKQWEKTFGGSNGECGMSVQQTSDNGYIITGGTSSFGAGSHDVYLIKTDSNGTKQWEKTFGGSSYDYGTSVQQTSDNGYIIAGSTSSFGSGSSDVYLIKTDSNGNKQWEKTFGGSSSDEGWSVQQISDGGYIIAGSTWSFGAGQDDVYLIKLKGEVCIPIQENGPHGLKLDVVFVPDKDYNKNFNLFKSHRQDKINLYNSVSPIKENTDKFNFYYTEIEGDAQSLSVPAIVREKCSFANAFAILHTRDPFPDSADMYHHIFSAEGTNTQAFLHESGHALFGLADEYEDTQYPFTYYFQPNPYPNIWSSLGECQNDAGAEGWNPNDCRKFCNYLPSCGLLGWWKICHEYDIMQRGYASDGFGIACNRRINWKFNSLSQIDILPMEYRKIVVAELNINNNQVTELGSKIIYGDSPNYFNEFTDFKAKTYLSNGSLTEYAFWDPRMILIENGSIFNNNTNFTLILPFMKNMENMTLYNKTNNTLISINLSPVLASFCTNEAILGDPDCKGTINISLNKGWNLISIPLNLSNNSISHIFNNTNIAIYTYKNNSWLVPNEIGNKLGYWLKINESKTIPLVGTEIENKTINLNNGWNLIGYPYLEEKNISELFDNRTVLSYNGSWSSHIPNKTSNSLQTLKLGYGYWVKKQ